MEYLRLTAGLLLPWAGGYLCLAAVENRFNHQPANAVRQIGYGFFLGYAGLQALVLAQARTAGLVSFWPILSCLALITIVGGLLLYRVPRRSPPGFSSPRPTERFHRTFALLFLLCIAWTGLHLVFVAIEIVHRPVFPWDAWTNWIYRAKAWYHVGDIFTLDHPREWLAGTGDSAYSVIGNHYPTFVPVLALWAATALGYWSETLINLPVLLCGIALGLALYGQCREFGLPKWLASLGAYLLLSLPLVGAHLALAGKADIWMTGFTGLGFVALLHGIIRGNSFQVLLGLGMAGMGLATKLEGAAWFLAALATLALATHLRLTLLALLLGLLIAAVGWLLDITYLELPLAGGIGLTEGRIHIPLLGSYGLKDFDLWDDYQFNFLQSGTWHLLWTFVLISVCSLWIMPAGVQRRTIAAFYAVLLAAQLFIFEGTEAGQWAEDWTAINRLPLHFTPPLVFTLVILAAALLNREKNEDSPGRASLAPAVALGLALSGTLAYLMIAYAGSDAASRTFSAPNMRIVVGSGQLKGEIGLVEHYENNVAILSSGPVHLDTQQLGHLELQTGGDNRKPARFFWRNGNAPQDLHSVEIEGRGTRFVNLDELPEWRGRVGELGLTFFADGGRSVEFHQLTVSAHSLPLQLTKLAHDWSEVSLWSQKSVNWLPAGAVASTVPLPVLMSAWVVVTLLVTTVIARYRYTSRAYSGALLCALLAWAVLDLRWSANSLVQAIDTVQSYPLISAVHLDFGDDEVTRRIVERARPEIDKPNHRTIITGEDQSMRFRLLRAKYHALPAAAYIHEGPAKRIPAEIADSLLVLKKRYTAPGHRPAAAGDYTSAINRRSGLEASPVWDDTDSILLDIGK